MKRYKLMNVLFVVLCCVSVLGLVEGHIHSHKVPHVEIDKLTWKTWLYALLSSALVGACGVFPLVVNKWVCLDSTNRDNLAFRVVLYFAVGGLLGDVFLHLLPEAWGSPTFNGTSMGVWVLTGLFSFLVIEKVVKYTELRSTDDDSHVKSTTTHQPPELVTATALQRSTNGYVHGTVNTHKEDTSKTNDHHDKAMRINGTSLGLCNGRTMEKSPKDTPITKDTTEESLSNESSWFNKDISGYLNLVANCTDNFTHGLAIATSYVANPVVGLLTTLAILCHEIPHEIGDFAILLNSGFNIKEAARAQMTTACGGLIGVIVGLTAEHFSSASSWLLPFTAGGFLYIALVSIIPDLLESKSNSRQAFFELLALVLGIAVMAFVTVVEKRSCEHMPLDYH